MPGLWAKVAAKAGSVTSGGDGQGNKKVSLRRACMLIMQAEKSKGSADAFASASTGFRRICNKKPHERTADEIRELQESVPPMTFFLQLPRPMREELCLNMSVSTYRELDTIIAEGEVGHRFFVLLEGNVAVFKSVAKAIDKLRAEGANTLNTKGYDMKINELDDDKDGGPAQAGGGGAGSSSKKKAGAAPAGAGAKAGAAPSTANAKEHGGGGAGSGVMTKLGQQIAMFGPGKSFGELALLNNQKRAASIMALSSVELVEMTKEYYQRAMHCYHVTLANPDWRTPDVISDVLRRGAAARDTEGQKELRKVLSCVPFLRACPPCFDEALLRNMGIKKFGPQYCIAYQGQPEKFLAVVLSGTVSVHVADKISPTWWRAFSKSRHCDERLLESLGPCVNMLCPGDCFGLDAIREHGADIPVSRYSVVSRELCELAILPRIMFPNARVNSTLAPADLSGLTGAELKAARVAEAQAKRRMVQEDRANRNWTAHLTALRFARDLDERGGGVKEGGLDALRRNISVPSPKRTPEVKAAVLTFFRRIQPFRECDDLEYSLLAQSRDLCLLLDEMADRCRLMDFSSGASVYRRGEAQKDAFVVLCGNVAVYDYSTRERMEKEPGEMFGHEVEVKPGAAWQQVEAAASPTGSPVHITTDATVVFGDALCLAFPLQPMRFFLVELQRLRNELAAAKKAAKAAKASSTEKMDTLFSGPKSVSLADQSAARAAEAERVRLSEKDKRKEEEAARAADQEEKKNENSAAALAAGTTQPASNQMGLTSNISIKKRVTNAPGEKGKAGAMFLESQANAATTAAAAATAVTKQKDIICPFPCSSSSSLEPLLAKDYWTRTLAECKAIYNILLPHCPLLQTVPPVAGHTLSGRLNLLRGDIGKTLYKGDTDKANRVYILLRGQVTLIPRARAVRGRAAEAAKHAAAVAARKKAEYELEHPLATDDLDLKNGKARPRIMPPDVGPLPIIGQDETLYTPTGLPACVLEDVRQFRAGDRLVDDTTFDGDGSGGSNDLQDNAVGTGLTLGTALRTRDLAAKRRGKRLTAAKRAKELAEAREKEAKKATLKKYNSQRQAKAAAGDATEQAAAAAMVSPTSSAASGGAHIEFDSPSHGAAVDNHSPAHSSAASAHPDRPSYGYNPLQGQSVSPHGSHAHLRRGTVGSNTLRDVAGGGNYSATSASLLSSTPMESLLGSPTTSQSSVKSSFASPEGSPASSGGLVGSTIGGLAEDGSVSDDGSGSDAGGGRGGGSRSGAESSLPPGLFSHTLEDSDEEGNTETVTIDRTSAPPCICWRDTKYAVEWIPDPDKPWLPAAGSSKLPLRFKEVDDDEGGLVTLDDDTTFINPARPVKTISSKLRGRKALLKTSVLMGGLRNWNFKEKEKAAKEPKKVSMFGIGEKKSLLKAVKASRGALGAFGGKGGKGAKAQEEELGPTSELCLLPGESFGEWGGADASWFSDRHPGLVIDGSRACTATVTADDTLVAVIDLPELLGAIGCANGKDDLTCYPLLVKRMGQAAADSALDTLLHVHPRQRDDRLISGLLGMVNALDFLQHLPVEDRARVCRNLQLQSCKSAGTPMLFEGDVVGSTVCLMAGTVAMHCTSQQQHVTAEAAAAAAAVLREQQQQKTKKVEEQQGQEQQKQAEAAASAAVDDKTHSQAAAVKKKAAVDVLPLPPEERDPMALPGNLTNPNKPWSPALELALAGAAKSKGKMQPVKVTPFLRHAAESLSPNAHSCASVQLNFGPCCGSGHSGQVFGVESLAPRAAQLTTSVLSRGRCFWLSASRSDYSAATNSSFTDDHISLFRGLFSEPHYMRQIKTLMRAAGLLGNVPYFKSLVNNWCGFDEFGLPAHVYLLNMASQMELTRCQTGTVLVTQGNAPSKMCLLLYGAASRHKNRKGQPEILMTEIVRVGPTTSATRMSATKKKADSAAAAAATAAAAAGGKKKDGAGGDGADADAEAAAEKEKKEKEEKEAAGAKGLRKKNVIGPVLIPPKSFSTTGVYGETVGFLIGGEACGDVKTRKLGGAASSDDDGDHGSGGGGGGKDSDGAGADSSDSHSKAKKDDSHKGDKGGGGGGGGGAKKAGAGDDGEGNVDAKGVEGGGDKKEGDKGDAEADTDGHLLHGKDRSDASAAEPESVTVIAAEPCEVATLSKQALDLVVGKAHSYFFNKLAEYLSTLWVFKGIEWKRLVQLAEHADFRTYGPGETVVAQGGVPFGLYVIKSGECYVTCTGPVESKGVRSRKVAASLAAVANGHRLPHGASLCPVCEGVGKVAREGRHGSSKGSSHTRSSSAGGAGGGQGKPGGRGSKADHLHTTCRFCSAKGHVTVVEEEDREQDYFAPRLARKAREEAAATVKVSSIGPDTYFGDLAFIGGVSQAEPVSVIAHCETRVIIFPKSEIKATMHPKKGSAAAAAAMAGAAPAGVGLGDIPRDGGSGLQYTLNKDGTFETIWDRLRATARGKFRQWQGRVNETEEEKEEREALEADLKARGELPATSHLRKGDVHGKAGKDAEVKELEATYKPPVDPKAKEGRVRSYASGLVGKMHPSQGTMVHGEMPSSLKSWITHRDAQAAQHGLSLPELAELQRMHSSEAQLQYEMSAVGDRGGGGSGGHGGGSLSQSHHTHSYSAEEEGEEGEEGERGLDDEEEDLTDAWKITQGGDVMLEDHGNGGGAVADSRTLGLASSYAGAAEAAQSKNGPSPVLIRREYDYQGDGSQQFLADAASAGTSGYAPPDAAATAAAVTAGGGDVTAPTNGVGTVGYMQDRRFTTLTSGVHPLSRPHSALPLSGLSSSSSLASLLAGSGSGSSAAMASASSGATLTSGSGRSSTSSLPPGGARSNLDRRPPASAPSHARPLPLAPSSLLAGSAGNLSRDYLEVAASQPARTGMAGMARVREQRTAGAEECDEAEDDQDNDLTLDIADDGDADADEDFDAAVGSPGGGFGGGHAAMAGSSFGNLSSGTAANSGQQPYGSSSCGDSGIEVEGSYLVSSYSMQTFSHRPPYPHSSNVDALPHPAEAAAAASAAASELAARAAGTGDSPPRRQVAASPYRTDNINSNSLEEGRPVSAGLPPHGAAVSYLQSYDKRTVYQPADDQGSASCAGGPVAGGGGGAVGMQRQRPNTTGGGSGSSGGFSTIGYQQKVVPVRQGVAGNGSGARPHSAMGGPTAPSPAVSAKGSGSNRPGFQVRYGAIPSMGALSSSQRHLAQANAERALKARKRVEDVKSGLDSRPLGAFALEPGNTMPRSRPSFCSAAAGARLRPISAASRKTAGYANSKPVPGVAAEGLGSELSSALSLAEEQVRIRSQAN